MTLDATTALPPDATALPAHTTVRIRRTDLPLLQSLQEALGVATQREALSWAIHAAMSDDMTSRRQTARSRGL
jgi:hypothetical protein